MTRESYGPEKLAVLMDATQVLFSERLIHLLDSSGLEIDELTLSKGIVSLGKWAWKLSRSKAKIVHYLWGCHRTRFYIIPKLLGKKVVIHWIGSDVLYASSINRSIFHGLLRRIAYMMADLHLAVSKHLADELKPLGIDASVIPLVPDMPTSNEKNMAWPSANKVYVYLPETRQEFYGANIVFQLAQEMTDTEFLITGHSGKGTPQLPNLRYLGWVDDMEIVWSAVKVHLRLTKHDGLPQTLIEALARGKYVIWSNEFPHCLQARSLEEAKEALRAILTQDQANLAGMDYVRQQFQPTKMVQDLKQKYLQLVHNS